jgi:RimJ/RimL family protein N-acetyltransferase
MPSVLPLPEPPLSDGVIRLAPIESRFVPGFEQLSADPEVRRFTRVPVEPDPGFAAAWVGRYIDGWKGGSRAGFAILSAEGEFLGLAAIVDLDLPARQGEIGYIVKPDARGRGVAARALRLIAGWALGSLGLERVELRISIGNEPSLRVAERLGFVREGVLRSVHLKDAVREDVAVYSLLAGELHGG